MGKLVVTEFVTLDGVFEDPGGAEQFEHGGWSFKFNRSAEGDKFKLDELMAADAQLFGRTTYEGFAKAWPTRTDEVGFSERINSLPKYVVSSTLERADWEPSTILGDSWADDVARLKREVTGDILVAGSGRLVCGAARARPRRPAEPDGLPGRAGQRAAAVRRARGSGDAPTSGVAAGRPGADPDLHPGVGPFYADLYPHQVYGAA